MKTLIKNSDYTLCYVPTAVNRFIVFKQVPIGISGELSMQQQVARSPIFSKKLKSYFTFPQVQNAIAIVRGMQYAAKKHKA